MDIYENILTKGEIARKSSAGGNDLKHTLTAEPRDTGTGQTDQLARVRQQVDDVKGIMKDNIEKVIERDEKVSTLGERADILKTQTHGFKENATAVRKNAQRKNWKMTCCIVCLVLVILTVITVIILYALKII